MYGHIPSLGAFLLPLPEMDTFSPSSQKSDWKQDHSRRFYVLLNLEIQLKPILIITTGRTNPQTTYRWVANAVLYNIALSQVRFKVWRWSIIQTPILLQQH